jgi:uncharacterized protein YbjT (DUF2867 family)
MKAIVQDTYSSGWCPERNGTHAMRVCIVGASGKLGQYMVQHALDRSYEVVGVCRQESVGKLDTVKGRITLVPGATNDPEVIKRAVSGYDGVLVVLVPRGVHGYSTGTAQAVLDHAPAGARLGRAPRVLVRLAHINHESPRSTIVT